MSRNAERMMELFRGLDGVHGTHGVPERDHESGSLKWAIKKSARTLREPVTVELWVQHLAGDRPLGIVPIRADHTCQWGSIDVDQYDIDLFKLVDEVVKKKLPLMPCRSKSGGLHLFLFTAEPQPAAAFQAILRDIAASLGLAGSEIFPKQTQLLAERGDAGSWMVMPYYGGTFDGKLQEQVGLKKAGGSMALPEFLRKAEELRLSTADFEALGERRHATARVGKDAGPFADGPRCLQHMISQGGIQEGGRNNALLMVGIYLKKKFPGEWAAKLDEYNQNYFVPPLTSEEVTTCVNSLQKTEYDYTCKTEPMHSHCDVAVCRGRRFGVGEAGAYPIIASIGKLDIPETPIWFVHIEGQTIELSTEELQSFILFQRACMIRLNRTFRMMKQSDWVVLVAEAMANVVLHPPPSDAGNQEAFKELLTDFLTNQAKGQRQEDLFAGRPWEDPGLSAADASEMNKKYEAEKNRQKRVEPRPARHFFRLGDLMRFLEREKMRDLSRGRVTQRLKSMGGDGSFLNIRGRGVNVWHVPVAVIEPAPEMEAADIEEEPI